MGICTRADDWSAAETSSVTVVVVAAQILNYIYDRYILCKTHYNIIVIFTYSIQIFCCFTIIYEGLYNNILS